MPEEWLTLDEIAEELRVSVETVRRWIRTKQLKALSIGRGYRIRRKDFEDFLRRHTIDVDEEENS